MKRILALFIFILAMMRGSAAVVRFENEDLKATEM